MCIRDSVGPVKWPMCNVIALNADDDPTHHGGISQLQLFKSRLDDGAWVVSCPEQPRVLAQFRDRTQPADFKEVCRVTITYPPPAAQLHSLDFTDTHRPAWHNWASFIHHEVYRTSRTAVVVHFKENYDLSDHRGWRVLGTITEESIGPIPIPASIGQYPILQYRYRSNPRVTVTS